MTMKTLNSEDFLLLLLEDVGSGLGSKELASSIMRTFSVTSIVLEKNISSPTRIDISFPLYRKNNDFSLFLNRNTLSVADYAKWTNIFSSIKDIHLRSKYSFVDEIWLEFDEYGFDKLSNCIPGLYFNVLNFTPEKIPLIIELISKLRGGPTPSRIIDRCV